MKLTKAKILRAAPRWRRFVYQGRLWRNVMGALVAVFIVAMLLPQAWRVILIRAVFTPVFGALALYVATPLALDALAAALKKDALTAIWLAAFAAFLVFAAVQSFRLALTLGG